MTRFGNGILKPGLTCAEIFAAPASGVLIDGCDYYRELHRAATQATRSILIAGWQLDSQVRLLRGREADASPYPVELVPLLVALCEERPELEVHVLAWNASALFVFEREPLQALTFNGAHPRIHYQLDAVHPLGASHHQKLVVVDRAVAFLGGMDVCASRWDDHCHRVGDDRRVNGFGREYGPYHEVQAYVTGAAVDVLRGWFGERWQRAAGAPLRSPPLQVGTVEVRPTVAITAPRVGLARTQPVLLEPAVARVEELRELYVAAVTAARRAIYLENQYFSSEAVHRALLARLRRRAGPPLELVLVLPEKPEALKERIALGIRQAQLLRELADAAVAGGHHLGIYYTVDPSPGDEVPVYIHSKLLSVDDRLLLVSSANTTNRSMGLDTELGVAWEATRAEPSIRACRVALLSEHTGVGAGDADALLGDLAGLVTRLDRWADERRGRLRRMPLPDPEAADFLERILPADVAFDPSGPFLDEVLWRAAEDDDRGWLERMRAAWRQVRNALVHPDA
jgi:phospholipase D1/2